MWVWGLGSRLFFEGSLTDIKGSQPSMIVWALFGSLVQACCSGFLVYSIYTEEDLENGWSRIRLIQKKTPKMSY